jgi:hypothetical protein
MLLAYVAAAEASARNMLLYGSQPCERLLNHMPLCLIINVLHRVALIVTAG